MNGCFSESANVKYVLLEKNNNISVAVRTVLSCTAVNKLVMSDSSRNSDVVKLFTELLQVIFSLRMSLKTVEL